jgi:hypothetical protein
MALSSWTELKAAVADTLNRDATTYATQLADWIRLTEVDVTAKFRAGGGIRQMICRSEAVIEDEYERVPGDFAGVKAISIISTTPASKLEFVDGNLLRLWKDNSSTAGQPTHYTILGKEFQFYPAPDGEYTVELLVFENIPTLGEARASNWLLERFPNVYLFGALVQGATYLGNDPRLAEWMDIYLRTIDDIKKLDLMEQTGAAPRARIRRFG